MIVVSNTSPLTNLAAIGQLELLRLLYGQVVVSQGVWEELNATGRPWPGRDEVAHADWIERRAAQDQLLVAALQRDLDRGEAETIALALELKADLALLDEREGRGAGKRLGLHLIWVVGVLPAAKAYGAVSAVRPHLDALRQSAGFYLTDAVYNHALVLAGEGNAQSREG